MINLLTTNLIPNMAQEGFFQGFIIQLMVIAAISAESQAYDGCMVKYGRRGCYHRILTGVVITCDGRGTETVVPNNLPGETVYLSLVNFKLNSLKKEDFRRFPAVECLTIVDSGVHTIDADAFSEMEHLHELVLENTTLDNGHLEFLVHPRFKASLVTIARSPALKSINVSVTPNLREIKTLGLQDNNIETIDGRLFTELRNTERLILSHNRLKTLEWPNLREMTNLNKLSLDHNRFQTIPETVHSVFFAVKELNLAGNPFHCNCKLKWMREFFQNSVDKRLDFEEVICVSPHDYPMSGVPSEDFVCMKPSKPIIQWLRLDDNRYEINCSSTGDPAPTLQITLPGERTVITPPSHELSKVSTVSPQMLSIEGDITCEATNSEGTAAVTVDLPAIVMAGGSTSRPSWMMTTVVAVLLFVKAWSER